MAEIEETKARECGERPTTLPDQSTVSEENVEMIHMARMQSSAFEMLDAPLDKKLELVHQDKFIVHDGAKEILNRLEDILSRPRVGRPACHSLVGRSGSGKSALVKKFYNDHLRKAEKGDGELGANQVLIVELPGRCTAPTFGLSIHRALRHSENPSRRAGQVTDAVLRSLQTSQVRLIFFNEFDHIGKAIQTERGVVLHYVKSLTNLGISVVAVGSEVTLGLIAEDEQVEKRLRPLRLEPFQKGRPFRQFLATLETYYPLRNPSLLFEKQHKWIYERTGGIIGETVGLVNEAAGWALKNGRPCIDTDALKAGLMLLGG